MTFTSRALGLSVSLALALSACGGSGSAGSTGAAPSGGASPAATSAAPSAPAAGSTVTGKDLAATLSAAMTASPQAALTLEVTGGDGGGGTGAVTFAPDGSALQLTIPQTDTADQPVTMIQTADAVYIDGVTAGAKGKKWVRISEVSEKAGLFASLFGALALGTASFGNPDGLVRVLGVTTSLTVTSADAQGVTYTGTLPATAIVQIFPAALFGGDEKARTEMARRSADGSTTLTLVTDPQGRPTTVTYAMTGDGKPVTVTSTLVWGTAAPVAAPDPATVVEAAELEKQLTS